ncbi:protein of unknown function [Nitrospira defluvii]|uniref:Uncharacterized protein n=1 Tax=Nitrospira defluvii TaxID=330214 RepID=D8PAI0_9BACT|nr:protein of unknown function [Nitrospira defluvii]
MAPACQPQQQEEAHGERDEGKGNASQNPVGGSVRGRDRGGEEPGVSSWHLRRGVVIESGLTAPRGLWGGSCSAWCGGLSSTARSRRRRPRR